MSANRKRWNKVNTGPNTGSFVNEANESPENKIVREAKYANLLRGVEERRAFVPSYNKKLNDTGPNHPKEALLVIGHGLEGWRRRDPFVESNNNETKKKKNRDRIPRWVQVPKGSIVVMKAHPGDVTVSEDIFPLYVNALKKENEAVILDPIGNIDRITELFGSVSIFREGDMCPDIVNVYADFYGDDDENTSTVTLLQGGIASIPLKIPIEDDKIIEEITKETKFRKYDINENYKKVDLLITEEDTTKLLDNFKFMDPTMPSGTPGSLIVNVFKDLLRYSIGVQTVTRFFKTKMDKLRLHQSGVFERKPNCVTYALNCRSIEHYPDYVPEEVRLGYKSPNNLNGIVTYYVPENMKEQPRQELNVTTVLSQKRNSPGNKTLKNNLNMLNARKRVSSMAPEVQQEIEEAINQRRLTTLSRARAPRQNTRPINLKEYESVFQRRFIDPTYKQSLVNSLQKIHPGIEPKKTRKSLRPRLLPPEDPDNYADTPKKGKRNGKGNNRGNTNEEIEEL